MLCTFRSMDKAKPLSLAQRLMRAGVAKSHAYQLATGSPSVTVAIRTFRRTGIKIGPISEASDAEIAVLEKFEARADLHGATAT